MRRRLINAAFIFHSVVLFILLILFLAVKHLPLLGTLGFESANLLVTVLGPLFCLAAALNKQEKFVIIFSKELMWLLSYVSLWSLLLAINGFFHASCSQGAGLTSFLIIAVPSLLLNITIGAILATLINDSAYKILIFFLGLGIYYGLVLWRFSQELSFRILTHASFLMSKDLLSGDELSPAIMSFRAATFLLSLTLILVGINFLNQKPLAIMRKSNFFWLNIFLIIIIFLSHLMLETQSLNALGKNRAELLHDYRLLTEKNQIKIFGDPTKVSLKDATSILDEALFFQDKLATHLGTLSNAPVTIWLHKTDLDKFIYTGAQNVHFALPKEREIHIAGSLAPHPVLGHELAHIYVGEFSQTFLGLPGSGWIIPNLALTEGLAMALTKELSIHNGLSLFEQAHALYQAQFMVNIDELFSANPIHFVELDPNVSYIYAGAFLDFLLRDIPEHEVPQRLQALIKSGDLKKLGKDIFDLDAKQQDFMQKMKQPVFKEKIYWAQKTFKNNSILALDCRQNIFNEKALINEAIINHDSAQIKALISHYEIQNQIKILNNAIDAFLGEGAFLGAVDLIAYLDEKETQEVNLGQLKLKKLDALINLKRFHDAQLLLKKIEPANFSPAEQRWLTVVDILLNATKEGIFKPSLKEAALTYLFAKPAMKEIAIARFFYAFGQQQVNDQEPLNIYKYLIARMYLHNSEYALAHEVVQNLLAKKARLPLIIQKETEFMWALINMKLGHNEVALATFDSLLNQSQSQGQMISIKDYMDRIRFKSNNASVHFSLPAE